MSHFSARLWRLALLSFTLTVTSVGVTACGGGCGSGGGAQAEDLIKKLPAAANGFIVTAVDDILNREQRVELLKLGNKVVGGKVPEWVADVTHVAVVGSWGGEGGTPAAAVTCEDAAEHIVKLMAKENPKSAGDEKQTKAMRGAIVSMCEDKGPKAASCMAKAGKLKDLERCLSASGGRSRGFDPEQFNPAVVLVGTFDAKVVLEFVKKNAPGGEAADGLDYVHSVVAATVLADNTIVVGTKKGVAMVKDAWTGKTETLGSNPKVAAALEKIETDGSVMGVALGITKLQEMVPLSDVAFSYNLRDGIAVKSWFKGDETILGGLGLGVAGLKYGIDKVPAAKLGEMAKQMGLTTAQMDKVFAGIKELVESLQVNVKGDEGTLTAKTSLKIQDYLLGAITTVSTGAFTKYMSRAKTSEAISQIAMMYKGAATYFQTPKASPEGDSILPCQFPKSVVCTPAGDPCAGGDDKFPAADPDVWNDASWAALSFEMRDRHYYQYCFESSGTGDSAVFTASAYGDLDCDGVKSTFRRVGLGIAGGAGGECSVKGSSAYIVEKETE